MIKLNWDDTKNNIALSFQIPMAVISKSHKRLEKVVDGRFRDQRSRLRLRAKHGVDEFAIGWSRPWSPWLKGTEFLSHCEELRLPSIKLNWDIKN